MKKEQVKTVGQSAIKESKDFDIPSVLNITTGYLWSNMGDIYDILNYLASDELYTHQLGRVSETVRPHIMAQYPNMPTKNDVDAMQIKDENYRKQFILKQEKVFGKKVALAPIETGKYQSQNPITELEEMMSKK